MKRNKCFRRAGTLEKQAVVCRSEAIARQLNMTQGPFALFVEPAAVGNTEISLSMAQAARPLDSFVPKVSPANTAVYNVQSSLSLRMCSVFPI